MAIFANKKNKSNLTNKRSICRLPMTAEEKESCKNVDEHAAPKMSDITWRIFRIMAEFVDGFQFLSELSKEVTVFGSARLPPTNRWYQEAVKLGRMLAQEGYTAVTGGGPGIMEAINKGAYEAGGESIGLNIQLKTEQRINPYVKKSRAFYYFFTRKKIPRRIKNIPKTLKAVICSLKKYKAKIKVKTYMMLVKIGTATLISVWLITFTQNQKAAT